LTESINNGKYGVVTDANGLLYMRARYYSPELRRFVNADVVQGSIDKAITLNRYAYADGNPVSFVDPFGLAAEEEKVEEEEKKYGEEYLNSDALKRIQELAEYIRSYAAQFDVDPVIVGSVIFVEQFNNYNLVDVWTDWLAISGLIDMSVGVGQVRVSTVKYLEEQGYVPAISFKKLNVSFSGFLIAESSENVARYLCLLNDSTNVFYVAAYIKCLEDIWSEDYPEIPSTPNILGSLYNLGHEEESHENPEPSPFGTEVDYVYDLIKEVLE